MYGKLHHDVVRQALGELEKESQAQVGRVAVAQKRVGVKAVECLPQRLVDLAAKQCAKLNSSFGDASTLAADFLAFRRSETRKKVLEAAIAVVVPVELAITA